MEVGKIVPTWKRLNDNIGRTDIFVSPSKNDYIALNEPSCRCTSRSFVFYHKQSENEEQFEKGNKLNRKPIAETVHELSKV